MHVNRLCWWSWMSLFETERILAGFQVPFVQHQIACLGFSALCKDPLWCIYLSSQGPVSNQTPNPRQNDSEPGLDSERLKPGPHVTQPEILCGFIFQCIQSMDSGLHETTSALILRAALWSKRGAHLEEVIVWTQEHQGPSHFHMEMEGRARHFEGFLRGAASQPAGAYRGRWNVLVG